MLPPPGFGPMGRDLYDSAEGRMMIREQRRLLNERAEQRMLGDPEGGQDWQVHDKYPII